MLIETASQVGGVADVEVVVFEGEQDVDTVGELVLRFHGVKLAQVHEESIGFGFSDTAPVTRDPSKTRDHGDRFARHQSGSGNP